MFNCFTDIACVARHQQGFPSTGPSLNGASNNSQPPPPPPPSLGHIPAVRLKSEIPDRRMDPPPCVQNAMMKQDKKPFTYTPGGIDLSEIKSPRMARRIERNANYEGVTEVPQQRPPTNSGPLPPSALAVMQPQMHVQVFPSGPPPPPPSAKGCPPPPPPPPSGRAPPPPPPMQSLPTQKVVTSENQVVERPDMTKIIPDNPMALLRKTGGPRQRNFVDEMYSSTSPNPPSPPQRTETPRYQPPVIERSPPQPPSPVQQSRAPQQQRSPPVQQNQPRSPEYNQRYQPPVIERAVPEPPMKTSSAQLGSLYIPPTNQNQRVVSPPTPPERSSDSPRIQSPGTPTLKEAPRPWQQKSNQKEELPAWAKRDPPAEIHVEVNNHQVPGQRWPQQSTKSVPIHIELQSNVRPASPRAPPKTYEEDRKPNAVYVTQPVVLQHPGGRGPQIQPKVDSQGARIIPIQIERTNSSQPGTPERSFNRQQSWNNPSQSNSFKVIQKITNTDEDDEDAPVTSHSPKFPQNFQQAPVDPMRRMKMEEDRNFVDRFKQELVSYVYEENPRYRGGSIPSRVFRFLEETGANGETFLHNEVDPRYRGPAIPSKAFKFLQNMTDSFQDFPNQAVSHGPQPKGPQVRTIPVQIEGEEAPQKYVHPSQQTVPEPKKYTGGSIPSRSFKILQAMTSDGCANVNRVNENIEQPEGPYEHWGFDPNYPPPYPFWYHYLHPNSGVSRSDSGERSARTTPVPSARATPVPSARTTPVPFWAYPPPPPVYMYGRPLGTPTTDPESDCNSTNPRTTPLPFYPYGYPPYYPNQEEEGSYDPYYYPYYYGYPMYPPYPYYGESETGYSSTDEMNQYNRQHEQNLQNENNENLPRIVITPTQQKEQTNSSVDREETETDSESDSDTEVEEENNKQSRANPLMAIASVKNINLYDTEQISEEEEEEDHYIEEYSQTTEDTDDSASIYIVDDDTLPHQLSVIMEESEKTRSVSRLSDSTTIAEDDFDDQTSISINLSINNQTEEIEEVAEEKEIQNICNTQKETNYDDFKNRPPSVTPSRRSSYWFDENAETFTNNTSEETQEDFWAIISNSTTDKKKENDENHVEKVLEENKRNSVGSIMESFAERLKQIQMKTDIWLKNNATKSESNKEVETEEVVRKESPSKEEDTKSNNDYSCENTEDKSAEKDSELINDNSNVKETEECEKETQNEEEEEIDFWSQIGKDEDDFCIKRNNSANSASRVISQSCEEDLGNKEEQNKYSSLLHNEPIETESKSEEKEEENQKELENNSDYLNSYEGEDNENEIFIVLKNPEEKLDDPLSTKEESAANLNPQYEDSTEINYTEETKTETASTKESDSFEEEESESDSEKSKTDSPPYQEPLSIKERIKSLQDSIVERKKKICEEQEIKSSVKEKVNAFENCQVSKTTSRKSSLKSFEEYSEEEIDSGVISDISRHISDSEEFTELKKMSRYQRAATHSRLFKLLQDECDDEDEVEESPPPQEDKFSKLSVRRRQMQNQEVEAKSEARKNQLSLPLTHINEPDSVSSSGLTSPSSGSSINEKLVSELVQSLLMRKKGQAFRNMPKEKLYAAAVKILQEDAANMETPEDYNSFLSPLRGETESSTPAQTPQEFYGNYHEYRQYYDSWSEAERLYNENYDILPSKAFKLLQEQGKTGTIGLLARCPRILSSKNVPKDLAKLLETQETPSPSPEKSLEANEVKTAS